MSYDESIADRVRTVLASRGDVIEKRMFGGLAFLVRGHMCCGVLGSHLVVRVGPASYPAALKEPHAREMDFTGRALKGLVYVGTRGLGSDEALRRWVDRALEFVASLPRKPSGTRAKSRRRQTRSARRRPS
ncbi:MAG TPA: TfoX/Sxy family protein [Candidatus Methylomirabilis sp.]|nr:TfoX/Sxy family protein [Candidatus Methylomirabilis sp.]